MYSRAESSPQSSQSLHPQPGAVRPADLHPLPPPDPHPVSHWRPLVPRSHRLQARPHATRSVVSVLHSDRFCTDDILTGTNTLVITGTISAIAATRWFGITQNIEFSRKCILLINVTIWISAFLITSPILIFQVSRCFLPCPYYICRPWRKSKSWTPPSPSAWRTGPTS